MTVPSYLRTPVVPLHRAWNTWAANRYIEMIFKPLGVNISPLFFAASAGKAVQPGPGHRIRLGAHEVDGSRVEATVEHAGTEIAWNWVKHSNFDIEASWKATKAGEWGLRFWICLVLRQEDGALWHFDEEAQVAHCTVGPRTVAVSARRNPLLVTGHQSEQDVATEFETRGYWYLESRSTVAPVLALRFNLEEAAANSVKVAIADRRDLAIARASQVTQPRKTRAFDAPSAAIRDIMGWNTIWDEVNHRPYITCSRNWDLKKFGGFGFWLNDTAVNALLVSMFDADQARECLSIILSAATPEGNLPCIMTGNDAWVDRTQAPLVSYIAWQIYERIGNRALLELAYPILRENNLWLRRMRDGNGNGLLEFGSSDVGLGLYKGTKLAAKDESFMDNSPMHDEASWIERTRTLDSEDVGLNSLCCLDSLSLARMAEVIGEDPSPHRQHAAELRAKISRELWDDTRGIFANRLWSGKFVRSVTPTSFFPLLVDGADAGQLRSLIEKLDDPEWFGGTPALPSVARHDPSVNDNVYWRGRIWPILNWLTWSGLKNHDAARAEKLRQTSWQLFQQSWEHARLAPENYHPVSGEGLDQPDTDPFYSWTGLLPFMMIGRSD